MHVLMEGGGLGNWSDPMIGLSFVKCGGEGTMI